jgi:hypothetical protein
MIKLLPTTRSAAVLLFVAPEFFQAAFMRQPDKTNADNARSRGRTSIDHDDGTDPAVCFGTTCAASSALPEIPIVWFSYEAPSDAAKSLRRNRRA